MTRNPQHVTRTHLYHEKRLPDQLDDIANKLPARITSILNQKNNKERYSIFIHNEFLIGVSESSLLKYKLGKGVKMTPVLFKKLQKAEGHHAVKSYCLRMLARRDYSRKELLDKAIKKDYPKEIIHVVLDELEEKKFLNDRLFAEKFTSDKSRFNNWGPAKIKSHLYKKGIPQSVAEATIDEAFEVLDLEETFLGLIDKKRRHFLQEPNLLKRKKKIFDYLKRKGYRPDSILNYLDKLAESLDS